MESQGEDVARMRTLPGLKLNPQSDTAGEGSTVNIKNMVTIDQNRGRSRRGLMEHDSKDRDSSSLLAIRADPPPEDHTGAFISTVKNTDDDMTGLWEYQPRTQTRYAEENITDSYSGYAYFNGLNGGTITIWIVDLSDGSLSTLSPTVRAGAAQAQETVCRDASGNGYVLNFRDSDDTLGTVTKFNQGAGIVAEMTCNVAVKYIAIDSAGFLNLWDTVGRKMYRVATDPLPSSMGAGDIVFTDATLGQNAHVLGLPSGKMLIRNTTTTSTTVGVAPNNSGTFDWKNNTSLVQVIRSWGMAGGTNIASATDHDSDVAVGLRVIAVADGAEVVAETLKETDSYYSSIATASDGSIYVLDRRTQGGSPTYTSTLHKYNSSGVWQSAVATGFVRDALVASETVLFLNQAETIAYVFEVDSSQANGSEYAMHAITLSSGSVATTVLALDFQSGTTNIGLEERAQQDATGQYYRKIVRAL